MESTLENKELAINTNGKGAPLGNNNNKRGKLFYDALRIALVQEDRAKLRKITDKLVKAAEDGEAWAIKEIIDRIDGKAIQGTEISGADGTPFKMVVAWER